MEKTEFLRLLGQSSVMQNLVITGLRGIGKTVLLTSFKPVAIEQNWLWAGTDCSEQASISEDTMALRILTDTALITSGAYFDSTAPDPLGFKTSSVPPVNRQYLDYVYLRKYYESVPGLVSDKLKRTLEFVWQVLRQYEGVKGVVFAYDEAQTLSDQSLERQYPLSLLLDVFQYLQRTGVPFMLVLTGLPTLMTRLVEARTYSERLFHVLVLDKLSIPDSQDAILRPLKKSGYADLFNERAISTIIEASGGYPYFIQFICREAFDVFYQQQHSGEKPTVPIDTIIQKLDNDFFAGRWNKATDRERDLMQIVAETGKSEFTVQEVTRQSELGEKPFGASQVSRYFKKLTDEGLIYKNRRGSYSFAVPLLERFIIRSVTQN
jgi:hypothetical protein